MSSSYPFPPPYPTLRTCKQCGGEFRLVDFRRWQGFKRILFETCNFCKPEAALDTPERLRNAVDQGRVNPLVAAVRIATQQRRAAARHSDQQLARYQRERRAEWNVALFAPLAKELTWAKRAALTCRMYCDPTPGLGTPLEPTLAAAYRQWQEFFEAYAVVLSDVQRRARNRLGLARGGKLNPTPEDVNVMTYVFPQTLGSLRRLYSACRPLRNRKPFKEPLFLSWRTDQ